MSRNRFFAIVVLAVVPAVLLALTLMRNTQTATPIKPDAQARKPEAVQPQASPLPRTVFAPAPDETTRAYVDRQLALAKDPVKTKQALDAEIAELERRHRAEAVDAAWKAQAEAGLAAIATSSDLEASGIAPTAYSNECRSSTCRISAEFKSNGEAEDWNNMFITMSGTALRQTRSMVLDNADGTFELRVYGVRK